MYIYIYICVYTRMYKCVCTYVCMYVCMHVLCIPIITFKEMKCEHVSIGYRSCFLNVCMCQYI